MNLPSHFFSGLVTIAEKYRPVLTGGTSAVMVFSREFYAMRAWLREPRDYASLEVNRLLIATTCAPFEEPTRRPQMPCSEARAANYDR